MHWCRANTSLEDLAARSQRLVTLFALAEEVSLPKAVQLRKPLRGIRDERLQEHSLRHPAHPNLTALKAKLARQPHGLAASIAKQFGNSHIRHIDSSLYKYIPQIAITRVINGIYHERLGSSQTNQRLGSGFVDPRFVNQGHWLVA